MKNVVNQEALTSGDRRPWLRAAATRSLAFIYDPLKLLLRMIVGAGWC